MILDEVVERVLRFVSDAECSPEDAIEAVLEELGHYEWGALKHCLEWKKVRINIGSVQFEEPVTIDEAAGLLSSCFVHAAVHQLVTARIAAGK